MKKIIAVVSGGFSGEAEVSFNSANMVMSNLDPERYTPYQVVISDENWKVLHNGADFPLDKNDFSFSHEGGKVYFDLAFIVIHGTPGEDGKLQGYFDMLGIPYNSCSAITSGLTFDKYYSNHLVRHFGIDASASRVIQRGEKFDVSELAETIGFPCFVKPNKGGSSIGTFKVYKTEELTSAIEAALHEDNEVLVEKFIEGREVTCGVFDDGQKLIALPLTEVVSKSDFFDYKAKYTDGAADEITPARVNEQIAKEISETSLFLYKKLKCNGMVRVDYIVRPDNSLYFLEVNTVPGLSKNSIIPQQARAYGFTDREFFSLIIEEALNRRNK